MSAPTYEREIILRLFGHVGWYDLYELHVDKLLSPAQIALALNHLQDIGVVEAEGLYARLTDKGRIWVVKNRRDLFTNVKRSWAVPIQNGEEKLAVGAPYLPRLKSIDRQFFKKLT